jgi:hypothetical protein
VGEGIRYFYIESRDISSKERSLQKSNAADLRYLIITYPRFGVERRKGKEKPGISQLKNLE